MPPEDAEKANQILAGEFGATRVHATKNGSLTRIAFGRDGAHGPVYYAGILLSPEAVASLKEQLNGLS